MSVQRMGNNKVVGVSALGSRRAYPRQIIVRTIDDLLFEISVKTGAGEEVMWDTLRLEVARDPGLGHGLRFNATVDVHRDDVVAGLTAIAVAEHERSKSRE